jgi:hypothetical protein
MSELDGDRIAHIVDDREERLLLSIERLEVAQAAVIGVVFERHRPDLGKIVSDPRGRREIE